MLKETVTYENFDGVQETETLYFNLTKSELTDNLQLKDEVERLQQKFQGEDRELSNEDVKELLGFVKTLMRLSYGLRSADGKRFVKTPEIWEDFTYTMAYDTFLFSLFENPEKASKFMINVIPANLRAEVEAQMPTPQAAVEILVESNDTALAAAPAASKDPKEMSREELLEAFKARNQQ